MTKIKTVLLSSVVIGSLAGALSLYVGFQHNAQGELIDMDSGAVDYWYALSIFFSWAVPIGVIVAIGGFVIYFTRNWISRNVGKPASDERSDAQ